MHIPYVAIALSGVLSMALGFVWYGPLFGHTWLKVIGADKATLKAREAMQKAAGPLYGLQFLLTLLQGFVLSQMLAVAVHTPPVVVCLWAWAGFIVPTVAAGAMWNNDSAKVSWTRFSIQAGYYLVLFVMFGMVLPLGF